MSSSDNNQDLPNVTAAQEATVFDAKTILASKQGVLRELGKIEAFEFINKLATVATLKLLVKVKETKEYVGLTYELENGGLATVANWEEFCNQILHTPKRTIDDRLLNLNSFGEEFFEASQRIGLGNRELRKLRQLDEESQQLIINNEAVELGDKDAIKELIEDIVLKQASEKAELKKQVDDATETLEAVRENSATKQKELDQIKEIEAKRQFRQKPWERQTLDNVSGMMQAKTLIEQGVNQLSDIYKNISLDGSMDNKALDLIVRSLLSEAQAANVLTYEFTNELIGVFGDKYRPDITATDTFFDLLSEDVTTE